MAEYDFFEITGLSFDPPEKNGKKIKTAIEKAEKNLGGMLGSTTQQAQRDEINGKLLLLSKRKAEVLTDDGKIAVCFEELARERMKAAKKRLEAAIKLEKISKKELVVTNGKIKSQKKNTRLSKKSIEEVYKSHGFTIVDIDPLAAMPKFPTNAEKIFNELEILRGSKDPNPNGADLTIVYDLYGFAAYLRGEPENAAEYRDHMSTKDISSILDEYAKKNSMRNDPLGKLCNSIATAGKTNVFNNEANRKAYEQFLLYKSPELTELFAIMKDSVASDLQDPGFASVCIQKITEVFGDSNVALAIYNSEAGLKDDPYVPEKAYFSVKCEYCQNVSEFTSFDEAQRLNRCIHCGKELYKKCSHCGNIILISAIRCPECGFVFANIGLFAKYIALVETALKQGKLEEARENLTKAKTADPSEKAHTSIIEKKLDAEELKIAEPLKKLRVLMTGREYEAAENFLGNVVKQFPQINLADQRKEIDSVLSTCRDIFASSVGTSVSARISACLEILDLCVDFRQAKELINSNPPQQVSKADANFDDEKKAIIINWMKVNEPGISYCVVRKDGISAAIALNDGTIIANDVMVTSVSDNGVNAGKQYSYTIFAKRGDTVSKPYSIAVKTLSGVAEIHYWQRGRNLIISWRLPENCMGAHISYSLNGKEILLSENAHESVEIKNVEYGSPYIIFVAANYGDLGKSVKKQVSITPTPVVGAFQISASTVKDGTCNIGWTIADKGIDLQISVDESIVQTTRSEMKFCSLKFPPNNHYKIKVKAFSGGQWISATNELLINTYEPALIDDELSTITEKMSSNSKGITNQIELKIKINGDIPGNVTAFYCVVKTKEPGTSKAPWATESDVGGDADRIDYQTFLQWREITKHITAHAEDTYYVTLFSVYNVNGKEILSAPCKKKFNRPLSANIFWKASKSLFGTKMQIEVEANRPMTRRPELVLCASPQGKHLLSENDSSAEELLRLPEEFYEEPKKKITEGFEITHSTKKKEKVFLFVADNVSSELYSVRWMAGFDGKL